MVEVKNQSVIGRHTLANHGEHNELRVSEPILQVADLTVRFGGVSALQDMTFALQAGETTAVIGPNGAGKTTLLNAVCGLVSSTSTILSLKGEAMAGISVVERARRGIARSYQNPPLLENASVLENLMSGGHLKLGYGILQELVLPRRVHKLEKDLGRSCEEVLEFVGLSSLRDEPVNGLSHGMRKLVDIGRAIVTRPDLLLLDEPSSGLDSEEQLIVVRVINGMQERHDDMAILVVEHHMEVVRQVADQVLGMQAGTLLKSGTPSEVLDSQEFREALVGARRLTEEAGTDG